MSLDFLAIGDTAVDEFIRLKDAKVSCDINSENCTISMKWGDKLPFDFSVLLPGVGNAANAAVAAARLGLSAGFLSNVGKDRYGEETLESFRKEGVDTRHITVHDGIPTNHHYVLWYESERTILIKHEEYPYQFPETLTEPRAVYLSSAAKESEQFHGELAVWLEKHPKILFAFQPGTFQMEMGAEKLSALFRRSDVFICNKGEYQRVLDTKEESEKKLLEAMQAKGPKTCILTDGPKGAYALSALDAWKISEYPDPKPPYERTGAGDAFASTVVSALLLGKSLPEALAWGPVNSMSVVQEIGAQKGLLSRSRLEQLLAEAPAGYRAEPY